MNPVPDRFANGQASSWYLDPLVAEQKQAEHLKLIETWAGERGNHLLKTDLFEECCGSDQLLFALRPRYKSVFAMDINATTVARAWQNCPFREGSYFMVADLRHIGLASNSMELVLSNSSLDHFETTRQFETALAELIRVLRPGGRIIITMDNPLNPTYWLLRGLARVRLTPYPLGYTPSPKTLRRCLEQLGLQVEATARMIHNPRLISTALFLTCRAALGRRADGVIRALLSGFSLLERLPTRQFTACFNAASARKPAH